MNWGHLLRHGHGDLVEWTRGAGGTDKRGSMRRSEWNHLHSGFLLSHPSEPQYQLECRNTFEYPAGIIRDHDQRNYHEPESQPLNCGGRGSFWTARISNFNGDSNSNSYSYGAPDWANFVRSSKCYGRL